MDNIVIINGRTFISDKLLVDSMVKACVEFTETSDCVVTEAEADRIEAYQTMLEKKGMPASMKKLFHDTYVTERFIKRSEGF